jgi:TetR/AcrR family transcriptional repressor of nem operon
MKHFFDVNERWLTAVLKQGQKARELKFSGPPHEVSRALVGSLEGAMMLARSYAEPPRFDAAAERVIADLERTRA